METIYRKVVSIVFERKAIEKQGDFAWKEEHPIFFWVSWLPRLS
jgi:hypothetical protein